MTSRARAGGFAAISAILVAGAVASIGSYLAWQGTLGMRQTENIAAARQADHLVRAAVQSALAKLAQDDPRLDHLGEPWAREIASMEMNGARVDVAITDEQGKFNVNNLADANGVSEVDVAAFRRLLGRAGLPESLADAVVDWIDTDDDVTRPAGAEEAYYLARAPAYRTANRQVSEISELLLVKGFTDDILRRLTPYLTALPGPTKVNVNSASAEVLEAILPGVSADRARSIVAGRNQKPYGSKLEFSRRLPDSAVKAAHDLLDVRSDYFVVRGTVRSGRLSAGYRALVGREGPVLITLSKDFG